MKSLVDIRFDKYKTRGPGYHWEFIKYSIKKRNLYVFARYMKVIEQIDFSKSPRILDLGCGDGVLSYLLWKKGARVVGIDVADEAISYAFNRLGYLKGIEFVLGSAYDMPFTDESFDYVVSSDVIEHLEFPDKMISEIKRVLKENGMAVITTPIRFTEFPLDKTHFREFFPSEFKEIFEREFKIVRIIYSHPLFWSELQNKAILGKNIFKYLLNFINMLLKINPHLAEKGWRYYTLQTAVLKK